MLLERKQIGRAGHCWSALQKSETRALISGGIMRWSGCWLEGNVEFRRSCGRASGEDNLPVDVPFESL